jgi:Putative polyhydroxyalkanoic acid system protein (PHA_gran_rgn)
MTIQIEHTLSKQEAKNRMVELIEHYQEEYKDELQDLAVDWTEDKAHIRLKARGYSTAGNLEVRESLVNLDFYMPFLLQVFSKKITSTIQERIKQSLS